MSTATTFWRLAGMTYTQYVNTASACVRKGLKESLRAKAAQRGNVNFNVVTFEGGNPGPKVNTTSLADLPK